MILLVTAAVAQAIDMPEAPVHLTVSAHGETHAGILVVNADTLAAHGILFGSKDSPRKGAILPLELGSWVHVGSRHPELFNDAIRGLMLFDLNDDGQIDARDPTFEAISLFVDKDGNGVIGTGELKTFGQIGIEAITNTGAVRVAERTVVTPAEAAPAKPSP